MSDDSKNEIFSIIQKFLKSPPVIIWGSGATAPYGLPTMDDLNKTLRKSIVDFNPTCENLEIELGKEKYVEQMYEIKKIIWKAVHQAEKEIICKTLNSEINEFDGIKEMIEKFRSAHPMVVNIITTNYDRVIEYVLGYHNIPFSDGFVGREFSLFDKNHFKDNKNTNLVKVHGSLSWFKVGSNSRNLMHDHANCEPLIITPGKNKYQEAYQNPYRDLIQKSDALINNAKSFLVVGFGFNDEHLTPKIKEKVNSGTPLVLITKEITDRCRNELDEAQKFILLEEDRKTKLTSVEIKDGKDNTAEVKTLDNKSWQLKYFMEII